MQRPICNVCSSVCVFESMANSSLPSRPLGQPFRSHSKVRTTLYLASWKGYTFACCLRAVGTTLHFVRKPFMPRIAWKRYTYACGVRNLFRQLQSLSNSSRHLQAIRITLETGKSQLLLHGHFHSSERFQDNPSSTPVWIGLCFSCFGLDFSSAAACQDHGEDSQSWPTPCAGNR